MVPLNYRLTQSSSPRKESYIKKARNEVLKQFTIQFREKYDKKYLNIARGRPDPFYSIAVVSYLRAEYYQHCIYKTTNK